MNASTVYSVAKALSKGEQIELYKMLKADMQKVLIHKSQNKKEPVLTNQEAIIYLIQNVFSNNKGKTRT